MDFTRFGSADSQEIDSAIETLVPEGTKRAKEHLDRVFQRFLLAKNIQYDLSTMTDEVICSLLKNFAFNVQKKDGNDYKDKVLKGMWNGLAKKITEDIWKSQQRRISMADDPHEKPKRQRDANSKKTRRSIQ